MGGILQSRFEVQPSSGVAIIALSSRQGKRQIRGKKLALLLG